MEMENRESFCIHVMFFIGRQKGPMEPIKISEGSVSYNSRVGGSNLLAILKCMHAHPNTHKNMRVIQLEDFR